MADLAIGYTGQAGAESRLLAAMLVASGAFMAGLLLRILALCVLSMAFVLHAVLASHRDRAARPAHG